MALVSRDGSLDWCCFPHLESPSVFASLLDRSRGGRFSVAPVHSEAVTQRYLEHTNILETLFETDRGRLAVTDFMPLTGSIDGCGGSRAEDAVYRLIRAEGGAVEVEVEWAPRLDYGRADTRVVPEGADRLRRTAAPHLEPRRGADRAGPLGAGPPTGRGGVYRVGRAGRQG